MSKVPTKNKEGRKLINCKVDLLPNNEVKVTPIYEGDITEPNSARNPK